MKVLRLAIVLMLVLALVGVAAAPVLAGGGVDQRAELELKTYVEGAMGDAELRLKIDDEGMLELFRIRVDAEGLVAGGTYSLFIGHHLIATETADDGGTVSFDETLDMFRKDTLVGLKIKLVYGETVVLFGKVMEADLVGVEEEE